MSKVETIPVDISFEDLSLIAKAMIKYPESYTFWEEYVAYVQETGDEWSIEDAHRVIGKAVLNDYFNDAVKALIDSQEGEDGEFSVG